MRWQREAQALLMAIWLLPQCAFASIGITPQAVTETLTWNGGNIVRTLDFCVRSVQQPRPGGNTPIPYAVSPDILELTSGANTIPFTASWTDLNTGNVENLSAGVTTPETLTGDTAGCPNSLSPGGQLVNGQLLVTFDKGNLVSAVPGNYTGVLTVEVTNSGRGRSRFRTQITYSLTIPDSIRVTGLNTLDFGTFDGINDITRQDELCVFRRSGGTYAVVLSGQNTGGPFQVTNGPSAINYTVTWNDGTGAVNATATQPITGRQNSFTLDEFCAGGGANNATLSVTLTAADINAAGDNPGDYLGVLEVQIQAE